MTTVKGFYSIPTIHDNDPGELSPVGELDAKDLTYSDDIATYTNAGDHGNLMIFNVKNDDGDVVESNYSSGNGQNVAGIMNYIYTRALAQGGAGIDRSNLQSDLEATYTDYSGFEIGPMVSFQHQATTYHCPSWIRTSTTNALYDLTIWMSVEAFRGQYGEFTLSLIPPVENIDSLLVGSVADLRTVIRNEGLEYQLERVASAQNSGNFTSIKRESFEWVSPLDSTERTNVDWIVMVKGVGHSFDDSKEAIKAQIQDDSQSPGSWLATVPSLYGTNEYVIIPHWDRKSIPNQSEDAAAYSPIVKPDEILTYATNYPGAIPAESIEGNVEYVPVNYRGIGISVISNPESVDGAIPLYQKITDYMMLSTDSADFSRMSPEAQAWSRMMSEVLRYAETYTTGGSLPAGITRVTRGSFEFLSASLDGIEYLVAPRAAYQEAVGG